MQSVVRALLLVLPALVLAPLAHAGHGAERGADLTAAIDDVAERGLGIAEPMVFDLVCDLGAPRGTAEVNALAIIPLDGADPSVWEIAPEFEYAVADGFALELELPIEDGELESIKVAVQGTFGRRGRFIHGTQFIAERLLHDDAWDLALLYVPGYRFDDTWSTISLIGVGALVGPDVEDELGALVNTTLFADVTDHTIVGVEINLAWVPGGATSLLLMPQVHFELSDSVDLQIGVGAIYLDGDGETGVPSPGSAIEGGLNVVPNGSGWYPQIAARLIYNF